MQMPPFLKYIVAGSIAAILVPLATYKYTRFAPSLSSSEKALLAFTPSPAGLAPRVWPVITRNSPVNTPTGTDSTTAAAPGLPVYVPPPEELPRVSFILHDSGRNMAIINGTVLKEGNSINGWRLERIEQDRLLIAGKKGKKWLTLN